MLVFFEYFHDSFFRTSCFQFPVMETSGNNHILRQKFARLRLIIWDSYFVEEKAPSPFQVMLALNETRYQKNCRETISRTSF